LDNDVTYNVDELYGGLIMIKVVGVRFKKAGKIYYFNPVDMNIQKDTYVVVETARGVEFGECVIGIKEISEEDIVAPLKSVLRIATEEDINKHFNNKDKEKEAFEICLKKIQEHELTMKLIDVEYTFDNNKVIFYFTADGRVDFRELVKDLATIFKTRIELRQIGVRDEAKMLGGLGPCGRPMCCSTFLGDFASVSIKMAKEQNLSLNPTKISGICGRLMCCLNYEQSTYEDIRKRMPKVGSIVKTIEGTGEVFSNSTVKESVKVKLKKDGEEVLQDFKIEDIELIKGHYEDSIDDDDIKLEIESEEDRKLMKNLIKGN
jgi:cell fate regulator YaaT (PSP1 superfamily)